MVINRSKTGLGGSTAHERAPFGHAVKLRPPFGTSTAARMTIGAADLFGNKFVVPPSLRHEKHLLFCTASSGCNSSKRVSSPISKTSPSIKLNILATASNEQRTKGLSANASRTSSCARTGTIGATRKALGWQPIIWRCLVERES